MAKDINTLLKSKFNSIYRLELLTEQTLSDQVMIATPHEYIAIDMTAEEDYGTEYEDYLDFKSYNASFGVD